ncbi:PEP-CTERM sorting domain-containing protein [Thalassotalea marina]|uniref:Ice-binding protein C-terminal domain-containing protein n=1 Tax=Thalassotalea marina TaxID=1673741 RepID=A0A919ENE0_9GAMM|nr:PEP-CTERM sorting domain-containing protein [Thalassotalea marina]GHG06178.1 hypothetical protein GCM10017161_39770 [Thalassotalea marina]
MKNKMLKGLVASFAILINVGVYAGIMNFDDLEDPGSPTTNFVEINSYSDIGFQLTTAQGAFSYWLQNEQGYNNSAALFHQNEGGVTRLSALDGSLFNLLSIDLDTIYRLDMIVPVEFFGYDANGFQVASQSITLENDGWITFNFSSAFSGVSYVEWSNEGHHFDNISLNKVTSVPEPSTLAVFALGIMGLAFRKLNKQV